MRMNDGRRREMSQAMASLIPADGSAEAYAFSSADYGRVRELIKVRAGIELGPSKRNLVYGRLSRRLRVLGCSSFAEYLDAVADPGSSEAAHFLNALTTNVTEFFRENHHFELLADRVLPELARARAAKKRIRIWSAGCSSGEEPYSLAITVAESPLLRDGWDVKILATDIDSDVLATASDGIYPLDRLRHIDRGRLARFFQRGTGANADAARVRDEIRQLISFKHLNLMQDWPMPGPLDIIFCRNVIIYFDGATRQRLTNRYLRLLGEPGFLFLGHSESLVSQSVGLQPCGATAYRKPPGSGDKVQAA